MKNKNGITRRRFLTSSTLAGMATIGSSNLITSCTRESTETNMKNEQDIHEYNGYYSGKNLDRIAFPIGGMGAGMFCLDGTGGISHMSVHNRPEVFNEPCMFAAISLKGLKNGTKVLEGQVPEWKKFGRPDSANGSGGTTYGFPRFAITNFVARFPFAILNLHEDNIPLEIQLTGWSPFIPTDADNSSLPTGAFEYSFRNTGSSLIEAMFSYNSRIL